MASFESPPSSEGCYLSVHDRALSTIFTSVVGSVVITIVHGPAVAFFVGWNSYFGVIRICLVSAAGLFVNIFGPSLGIRHPFIAVPPNSKDLIPIKTGGSKHANGSHGKNQVRTPAAFSVQSHRRSSRVVPSKAPAKAFPLVLPSEIDESHATNEVIDVHSEEAGSDDNAPESTSWLAGFYITERNQSVSILGALCLMYALIYTPIIQVIWLKVNWSVAPPLLFAARALSVTVIALPYTVDTQARYGMALGSTIGSKKLVPRLVNLYMAFANVVLSIILVVLCVRGLQVSSSSTVNSPGFYAVAFFALLTPLKSLVRMPPKDAGHVSISLSIKGFFACDAGKMLRGLVVLLAMGFLGLITAGPSVGIYGSSHFAGWLLKEGHGFSNPNISRSDVKDLGSWLSCSSSSWWEKAVQLLP